VSTTFAAGFRTLDFVAGVMAWEEDDVAGIIRPYADRSAARKALIDQIDRRGT
jgi:hypothetical protein